MGGWEDGRERERERKWDLEGEGERGRDKREICGGEGDKREKEPHIVANAQKSNGRFAMGYLQRCSVILNAYGFPRMFALKAGWVQMELCWEMAISFLFVADGAWSVHQC